MIIYRANQKSFKEPCRGVLKDCSRNTAHYQMETPITQATKQIPYIMQTTTGSAKTILILIVILGVVAYLLAEGFSVSGEGLDWNEIRCQPHIIPIASLYGYDTQENFNYCMTSNFNSQVGGHLGPMYSMFGGFSAVLLSLVESAKRLKLGFATMYGGIRTILAEFQDRLQTFFIQLRVGAQRMKMLMSRIYSTFYSIIFMSMSGMTAVRNFTGTTLFSVIDTFCFSPDTLVAIRGRGMVPIGSVRVGDVFEGPAGPTVKATFQFLADGQEMVSLPREDGVSPIIVSTNHYLAHSGAWIKAGDHPAATPTSPWSGGRMRPIICLNTTDHTIPVGEYLFRDYDETDAPNYKVMSQIHAALNANTEFHTNYKLEWHELYPSVAGNTEIQLLSGSYKRAREIHVGDWLAGNQRVIGRMRMLVQEYVSLPGEEVVSTGTLVWDVASSQWLRAGDMYMPTRIRGAPLVFEGFVVLPGSVLRTRGGNYLRDYMEIGLDSMEDEYAAALETMPAPGAHRVSANIAVT